MPQALSTVSVISRPINKHQKNGSSSTRTAVVVLNKKVFRISLFLCILFLGTMIFYLYLNLQLVEANFNLRKIVEKSTEVETKTQALESEIIENASIKRIKAAADKLKLVEAKNVRFVKLSEVGSLSLEK